MIRVFHHYFSGRKLLLFLAETLAIAFACLAGAAFFAFVVARSRDPARALGSVAVGRLVLLSVAFVCTVQFALYLLDMYDLRVAGEDRARGMRVLKAVGVAVIAMGAAAAVFPLHLPNGTLLGGAMGAVAGTLLARAGMASLVGEPTRVLIVGRGAKARWLARAIEDDAENAFSICSFVDQPDGRFSEPGSEDLSQIAARLEARYVVSATESSALSSAKGLLLCRLAGFRVCDAVDFCERVLRRVPVSYVSALDLAMAEELSISGTRRVVKRCFDLAMSALFILGATPLMLIVALAIKVDSPGPVLYRQERVGRAGRRYMLWKFRSMAADAEKDGPAWAKIQDERVTRVGRFIRKTRMDELPQVINVLLGEMSFVGPRPERPVFVEQLKTLVPFYSLRETVQPGITGWAQIRYHYGASVEDARNKLEFDLYYVKHGSLFLDLAIMFHTIRHVLRGRGAR